MKTTSITLILLLFLLSCSEQKEKPDLQAEQFTTELSELKEYFHIPGLAVSIDKKGENIYQKYFGVADIEKSTKIDSTTLFPIASITKVFSGIILMKLVSQKKLSLDDPINDFLAKPILGDSILVKHILSHTSQGEVGADFYYSSRFGLLTAVIERVTGQPFADVVEDEIIRPLKLNNTFLLKDSTQIAKIAKPYILDDGVKDGLIDYGYSSSAGIVSNLEDLAIFSEALDTNELLDKKSKDLMFSSFKNGLPYGYGIFSQQFEDVDMVWAYGQYDCYSSLLLKIPSQDITLTLLANNNLLSDPARLIYGDAMSSLFVLSFLKNYILEFTEMPLLELQDVALEDVVSKEFYRKKVLAQALAESYMARFDPKKINSSAELLKLVFAQYPDYLEYADLNLLHNLTFLKDVAFYMDLGAFNNFDTQIVSIGNRLLEKEPNNPYVHSYLGTFYSRNGNIEKAKYHFESIVNVQNFSTNWYTKEAQSWLDENE